MKILLLVLMVTSFAFGGVIVPIVKRNNVQENSGALGTAWTQRVGHVGVDHNSYDDDTDATTNFSIANYGETFRFELNADEDGENTELGFQGGWALNESSVIALSLSNDGVTDGESAAGIAYGMKHSGNIYSGFGIRGNSDGEARSNAVYAGIGHYNNFDENKKSVKEIYVLYDDGDYNETTSDETVDEIKIAGEWTEIINDYQFFLSLSYSSGDSEEGEYEYEGTTLLVELEKRFTESFFVELSLLNFSTDYRYVQTADTHLNINGFSVNARYLLAKKHQLIAAFSNFDGNFGSLYIDGSTTSLAYQYLW